MEYKKVKTCSMTRKIKKKTNDVNKIYEIVNAPLHFNSNFSSSFTMIKLIKNKCLDDVLMLHRHLFCQK